MLFQGKVKNHTIEWLSITTGLDNPFITKFGQRPSTTTIHPDRDIDYILTWQVDFERISILPVNFPATLDHLAICLDIDAFKIMQCNYSKITQPPRRQLTSKNIKARDKYITYISDKWRSGNILDCVTKLYERNINNIISEDDLLQLQTIDDEITFILLDGEHQCCKPHIN
jgi:hypothetical protein